MTLKPRAILCLITLLLGGGLTSCKTVMPERYANYNGGRVNVDLPGGTKNAEYDIDIDKETSLVISLPDDSSIFIGKSPSSIPREMLIGKLKEWLKDRTDPDQLVYVAASVSDNYGSVVAVLDEVRKAGVSRAGLVANRLRAEAPSRFA
ncbi:MAG TPA: biopolymer transporter ExbD, partial [Pyrinomonadaceae bacterium]